MKECELCNLPARMYCESDEASLCWDCDAKVHSANFLVAKHSRNLLCHVCQLPTPWTASGAKLGWTVSVCESCANNSNARGERVEVDGESRGTNEDDDDMNEEEDEEDDDDDDEDGDGDDDEDGENQAVPWSSTPPPPPPVASSSTSDESSNSGRKRGIAESTMLFSFKRMRENADLDCQDDLGFPPKQRQGVGDNRSGVLRRRRSNLLWLFQGFERPKENPDDFIGPTGVVSGGTRLLARETPITYRTWQRRDCYDTRNLQINQRSWCR